MTTANRTDLALVKQQFKQYKQSWTKSFFDGFSQDDNGNPVPWMSYPAIEFLKNNLRKDYEIFEFGCGASTLFFADKVKKVVGLETNPKWHEIVTEKLRNVMPQLAADQINVEINLMIDGLQNSSYENFAKDSQQKFDLIIVDSLKRFECARNSIDALKPQGAIILDDSERKNYQKIFNFFAENNFTKQDFIGIAPGQLRVKNTTIFRKS